MSSNSTVVVGMTPEEEQIVLDFSIYVPLISTIAALLVFFVVLVTRLLRLPSASRLSFKLSLWVAFSDILYNLMFLTPLFFANMTSEQIENVTNHPIFVVTNIMLPVFGTLWYVLLTSAMSANLYYAFVDVQSKWNGRFTESNMVLTTFIISLVIIIPPSVACMVYDLRSIIYFTDNRILKVVLSWLQIDLWITISLIYNTTVVFYIIKTLIKYKRTVLSLDSQPDTQVVSKPNNYFAQEFELQVNGGTNIDEGFKLNQSELVSNTTQLRRRLNLVAIRVAGYSLVPVLTLPYFVIVSSYLSYNKNPNNFYMSLFYDLTNNLIGLLNAIVFCFDPALPDIYLQLKFLVWKKWYGNANYSQRYHNGDQGPDGEDLDDRFGSTANLTSMELQM